MIEPKMIRKCFLGIALLGALMSASVAAGTVRTLVHSGTIITMEPGAPDPVEGWMTVAADGTILAIKAGDPPDNIVAETTIDATGKFVMPGFISAHSHLWSGVFRGFAAESNLPAWGVECHRNFYGSYNTEGDFYDYTLYGGLDFIANGITTCYNWVSNPGYNYDYWFEQYEAHLAMEQRFIFGWAMDTSASDALNRKRLEAFLERAKADMAEHPQMLGVSLSAIGMLRGDTEIPHLEGALMRDYGLDAQMHYLEAPSIKHRQHNEFAILQEAGMINEQMHIAHFIHTTDQILEETVDAGARMVWNAMSNGRLASGLADIPKYKRLGLRIGMGLDGQASGDIADPFENMRIGLYAIRMKYETAQVMTPYQVLAMHTIGSAEMLNVADKVGSLEPGKFADFIIADPKNPDAGYIVDPYATIVLALSARNLDTVHIGGDLVWDRSGFAKHDFGRIRDSAHSRLARMIRENEAAGIEAPIPTYQKHFAQP